MGGLDIVTPGFGLIFWQTITFLIVLFVLSRYAWKPISKALKDREESINNALLQADKARTDMEQLKADNEKLLDEARIERDKILKSAQQTAQEMRDEAKSRAQADVDKMIADAHKSIEAEKQAAMSEIKKQIAVLSVDIAEKILQNELQDAEKQKQLATNLIKDIQIN